MSHHPIADYALLSDCRSAALVHRSGSVDWLCFPRYDAPSVFGRLLDHAAGHWDIQVTGAAAIRRRYLDDTLVLETANSSPLVLSSSVPHAMSGETARARLALRGGESRGFALQYRPDGAEACWTEEEIAVRLAETIAAWRSWSAHHQRYEGPWRDLVLGSGRVLQGLTYEPTGAIVAAPTTSLPEGAGGTRNWDYRYTWVRRRWRQPDQGIWEIRGEPRHFLHSKLMCWVALDRALDLAESIGAGDDRVRRWQVGRDEIRSAILEQGWNERARAFTQTFGGDALDASTLLIPIVGFLPGDDPRVRATVDAVAERLTANDLGLLAEEADGATGELLGNFPQAFSHIGLVNAAWAIAGAEAGRVADATEALPLVD